MPDSTRVSVIIPFHNRRAFLREAVASVLADLDPARDEVIAVDDGSTDGSREILSDLDVGVLHLPRSLGPAAARNAGLEAARGEFITFFDSDDLLLPGAISERLHYLESHPEEVAVGGHVEELIDSQGNVTAPYQSIHFYDVLMPPYRLTRELLEKHRSLPMHLWCVLFRRKVFDEIGPLDSWLRCGEDLDFFMRLLKRYSIPFIPCPVGQYRVHEENLSLRKALNGIVVTETAVASQYLICRKHGLALRETPLENLSRFTIGPLTVSLQHPNDPLGHAIEGEFAAWKTHGGNEPEAQFAIETGIHPPPPEEHSIRTRFWDEFKSYEYRRGNLRLEYFNDNYFARKDFDAMKVFVSYREWEKMAGQLGGSAFKWLIIKGLEKHGFGYIHGAAVCLNDRTLIFSGHPGSGKSSCARRLLQHGARILTDDTVLFQGTSILPFDCVASVRGDFASRFGQTCENLRETEYIPRHVAAVVFPRVWQCDKSLWTELDREEGMRRLLETYITETEWNTYPEPLNAVRSRYERLLPQTRFFEFLASTSESEVAASLWEYCRAVLEKG